MSSATVVMEETGEAYTAEVSISNNGFGYCGPISPS
jgi:hypothetical protein